MTLEEQRDIIEAAIDRKDIQRKKRNISSCDEWYNWDITEPTLFNFHEWEYRVKPDPMVIWVNIYPDEMVIHKSLESAKRAVAPRCLRQAKFVEEVS